MVSTPTAIPSSMARPSSFCRSQTASTAGTITAPAWTGPPSKVSSKSSPWMAVPFTSAAAAAENVRGVTDRRARPVIVAAGERDLDVILIARGDGETDDVDQKLYAFLPHGRGQARGIERANLFRQMLGNGGFGEVTGCHRPLPVMPGLAPGIHVLTLHAQRRGWPGQARP